ncbi:MAG: hypothetical protein K0B10_12450 [Vicingaceae bacterium]|nr:hypothetical protein [Vicingaceae bacterium]
MNKKQLKGSETAKGGFKNEEEISEKFLDYKNDIDAQEWLKIMGYDYSKIKNLNVIAIPPRISKAKAEVFGATSDKINDTIQFKKADVQLQLNITIDNVLYRENLSLKKANKGANFNQIDKRPVGTYQSMWGFKDSIANTLRKFTGEIIPNKTEQKGLRDKRRWYLDELEEKDVVTLINFFKENKVQIFNDILRGRGVLSAEWFLVTRKDIVTGKIDWVLKDINYVANFFSKGNVEVSKRGGLNIGKITAQRKGGTPDPKSLQFKINPLQLFEA